MKRIDGYLLRELIVPFLIGTVAVVLMFAANQLIFIYKSFPMQNVPKAAVFQSLLYKIPSWLNMTLPVGTSLGASLAFSRLQRESELTAMRAAGARILRVVAPVAFFGLIVAIGNFLLVETVMPKAEKKFNDLATRIGIQAAAPSFRARAVVYLDQFTASFGMVTKGSGDELILKDILLFDNPSPTQRRYIEAKTGTYKNGQWDFENAFVRTFDGDDIVTAKPMEGGHFTIYQKIVLNDLFTNPVPEEKTLRELQDEIRMGRKAGLNTADAEVQMHTRFSVPAACIVFALVGPVFAVLFSRSGAFVGVLLSIILVMLYYNVFVITTQVLGGQNAILPAWAAAWAPNILFAAMGLFAIRRLE